jgi:glutamate-1-semialdehyde 2,1-aminomutase
MPQWQFTLSATTANTEAIRLARAVTGRDVVLLFDGHYHAHLDESLVGLIDGVPVAEESRLPRAAAARTVLAPFNDIATVRQLAPPGRSSSLTRRTRRL